MIDLMSDPITSDPYKDSCYVTRTPTSPLHHYMLCINRDKIQKHTDQVFSKICLSIFCLSSANCGVVCHSSGSTTNVRVPNAFPESKLLTVYFFFNISAKPARSLGNSAIKVLDY